MIERAISGRTDELGGRAGARRGRAVSEQAELEVSRRLVALVALGAAGILAGFWGLVAWGLYALFV
jgi:hypothetical protein